MGSEKHWIDNDHYRVVSDDGKRSEVYEATIFHGDICTEVAEHHSDGTTTAYEADNSFWGGILSGGKGDEK